MSIIPLTLISSTSHGIANGNYNGSAENWSTTSVKGAGYYNYYDGLHTLSVQLTDFVGSLVVQATLEKEPTESDWFNIVDTQIGNTVSSTTINTFKNFTGNFVWVRVAITNFTAGTINKVLYN